MVACRVKFDFEIETNKIITQNKKFLIQSKKSIELHVEIKNIFKRHCKTKQHVNWNINWATLIYELS